MDLLSTQLFQPCGLTRGEEGERPVALMHLRSPHLMSCDRSFPPSTCCRLSAHSDLNRGPQSDRLSMQPTHFADCSKMKHFSIPFNSRLITVIITERESTKLTLCLDVSRLQGVLDKSWLLSKELYLRLHYHCILSSVS